MILKNLSQSTVLNCECKIVTSIVDSLFGLLKKDNHALLLKTRFGIHTFGLSNNIDVIILNSTWKVVKLKQNIHPNRIFFWNPKFSLVLELPYGSIKKSNTKLGDQITHLTKKSSRQAEGLNS